MSRSRPIFLDTNILVYQFDRSEPTKQKLAIELIEKTLHSETARISSQVIQEFINVALHKFVNPLRLDEMLALLQELLGPICAHFPSLDFYQRALELFTKNSINLYDALIIQAALDMQCNILYSEDLQDGRQFGDLIIQNPFK